MFHSLAVVIASLMLTSCIRGCSGAPSGSTDSEVSGKRVNLFIWGEYTSEKIFEEFEAETGIKVVESNYSSNEEMLAKIQAGADGYDVIIPSDNMVSVMQKLDLLAPLDLQSIPNVALLSPELLHKSFDTENRVSLPYSWAVTGIIYNRSKLKDPVKGYRDLFEREDLKYRVSLVDDGREAIGAALKTLGYSINTVNDDELSAAKAMLIAVKGRLREFNSSPVAALEQGDLLAAQIFSNEALRLAARNADFEFVLPEEGFVMSIDNMAIPKASKRKENAEILINYLLQKRVNLQFSQELLAAPVVKGVVEELSESMRTNPAIGRFDLIESRSEMMRDLGPGVAKYDRIWIEVKASAL